MAYDQRFRFRIFLIVAIHLSLLLAAPAHAGSTLSHDVQGRPTTEVSVNESEPLTFVVDTAAQSSAVGQRLIDMLDLQPDPEKTAQVHGSSGVTKVPLYEIDNLMIGGVTFDDILAPSMPHIPDTEALGVIGMNLFAGKRILFDRHLGQLSVTDSGSGPLSGEMKTMPAVLLYGTFAKISVEIGGIPTIAIVDSGAKKSIANRKLMQALGLTDSSAGLSTVVQSEGVTGHDTELLLGYEGTIALPDSNFSAIPLAFSDLPVFNVLPASDGPALILGNDALNQLSAFALDYGSAEFQYIFDRQET